MPHPSLHCSSCVFQYLLPKPILSFLMAKIDVLCDDRGLQACIEGANIKAEWATEFLRVHHIVTLDDFIYLVTAGQWETSLADLVAACSFKNDRIAGARFKSAYLAGSQALKQSLEVTKTNEDPDQPLPESTTHQLNRDWDKKYSIKWEAFVDPADSLRARVYREFKKHTMSLIECRKVKSILTHSIPRAHEEVQLQGGVKIAFDKEVQTEIKSVIDYYFALRTLTVAWAWGGNWMTKDRSGKDVLMMDLSTAMSYADRALADCATYGRNSMTWLSRNDLLTRGTMASLMRQQWPAGEALQEALRQHHVDWKSPVMQGALPESPPKRSAPDAMPPTPQDSKRARLLKADGLATISMVKGGRRLCKTWNDSRGCQNKRCENLHQCDVKMPSGKACLSKSHNRLQHAEAVEWQAGPRLGVSSHPRGSRCVLGNHRWTPKHPRWNPPPGKCSWKMTFPILTALVNDWPQPSLLHGRVAEMFSRHHGSLPYVVAGWSLTYGQASAAYA